MTVSAAAAAATAAGGSGEPHSSPSARRTARKDLSSHDKEVQQRHAQRQRRLLNQLRGDGGALACGGVVRGRLLGHPRAAGAADRGWLSQQRACSPSQAQAALGERLARLSEALEERAVHSQLWHAQHAQAVRSVCASADGLLVFSCAAEPGIRVWDAASLAPLQVLQPTLVVEALVMVPPPALALAGDAAKERPAALAPFKKYTAPLDPSDKRQAMGCVPCKLGPAAACTS